MPAADREGDVTDDTVLTGALPTPPMPKSALVTGGARRIGRALVLALAEGGFAVAIHHLRITVKVQPALNILVECSEQTAVVESAPL